MSKSPKTTIAMMSAQTLAASQDASDVPEWVHLLPADLTSMATGDNRGPYHVTDAAQMIADSFLEADRLPIDENHATDLAAPLGNPSPARGWIVELQQRADGIWGKVEWSEKGKSLIATKAYRSLSPVISHDKTKKVLRILRASLVNRPNLRGLTALNQEGAMTLLERLVELLGLDAAASETEVFDAVTSMKADKGGDGPALQSQLAEIGVALGLGEGGDAPSILAAAKKAKSSDGNDALIAMQAENTDLATKLNSLSSVVSTDKATAFVDAAIASGTVGVKPMRDHYIAMHMEDPARVEKELGALPKLSGTAVLGDPPPGNDEILSMNAEEIAAKATAYQSKLAESGQEISIAVAVRAIEEGKL